MPTQVLTSQRGNETKKFLDIQVEGDALLLLAPDGDVFQHAGLVAMVHSFFFSPSLLGGRGASQLASRGKDGRGRFLRRA